MNSAGLAELGIDAESPEPVGGEIVRDPSTNEPTGHLQEMAAMAARDQLADMATDQDGDAALATATAAYTASGVTAAVDMGLDERALESMIRAERDGALPMRVVAHWLVSRTGDRSEELAQVQHAAALASRHRSQRLRVTGVSSSSTV